MPVQSQSGSRKGKKKDDRCERKRWGCIVYKQDLCGSIVKTLQEGNSLWLKGRSFSRLRRCYRVHLYSLAPLPFLNYLYPSLSGLTPVISFTHRKSSPTHDAVVYTGLSVSLVSPGLIIHFFHIFKEHSSCTPHPSPGHTSPSCHTLLSSQCSFSERNGWHPTASGQTPMLLLTGSFISAWNCSSQPVPSPGPYPFCLHTIISLRAYHKFCFMKTRFGLLCDEMCCWGMIPSCPISK